MGELLTIFLQAIRFDLTAIIYVNSLLIFSYILPIPWRNRAWYHRIQKILFVGFNSLAILVECIDIGFFKFAFRRTIWSDLSLFKNTIQLIPKYIAEYWYLLLFVFLMSGLMYYLYQKSQLKPPKAKINIWIQLLLFPVSLAFFVVLLRGGFQLRPLMPITAAQYVPDMRLIPLMTNTSLNLIFSTQQRHLKNKHYFEPSQLDQIYSLKKQAHADSMQRRDNVMLIVLESFGKEYTGFFNDYEGATPFLDSLLKDSYSSEFSYANGLRSTQGIVAISAGIPGLMDDPLMFSAYQSNRVDGLASLLKNKGYQSAFFHGANEGSMEFERFSKVAGFEDYFDRRDYANDADYDGNWGIWDDPFFQYTAQQLNEFKEPFFAQLFSLTSHHPYKVEKWFQEKYPEEEDLYRSVRYTDYALAHFFETASQMPWFKNTLFVFTADHVGISKRPIYKTKVGKYQIPIFFYKPGGFPLKDEPTQLMQQSDILPSILDYLGYDEPYSAFGNSVFDSLSPHYAYMLAEGIFQILDKEYILFFDESETVALYHYQNDPMLKDNLKEELPAVRKRLEQQIKAVIQRHHQAMIENQLSSHQ